MLRSPQTTAVPSARLRKAQPAHFAAKPKCRSALPRVHARFAMCGGGLHGRLQHCSWPTAAPFMADRSTVHGRPRHYSWPTAALFMADRGTIHACGGACTAAPSSSWARLGPASRSHWIHIGFVYMPRPVCRCRRHPCSANDRPGEESSPTMCSACPRAHPCTRLHPSGPSACCHESVSPASFAITIIVMA